MIEKFFGKNIKIDVHVALVVSNIINSNVDEDVQDVIDGRFLYKQNLFWTQTINQSISASVQRKLEC